MTRVRATMYNAKRVFYEDFGGVGAHTDRG